jgi:hypothetical protein
VVALGAAEIRFAVAYLLRLATTHLDLLVQGGPSETAALLAGIVRQFLPQFEHPDPSAAEIDAAATRAARALTKSIRTELAPFVAEIAVPIPGAALHGAVHDAGARAGLLACADLGAAMRVLCLVHGQDPTRGADALAAIPVAMGLMDFALSGEHEALVAALDAGS